MSVISKSGISALRVHSRVRLAGESRFSWTVQVAGDRYTILTRQAPFRPKGDLDYTICDNVTGKRGPTNVIGNGWDFNAIGGAYQGARLLHIELLAGRVEISRRQSVPFTPNDIELKP